MKYCNYISPLEEKCYRLDGRDDKKTWSESADRCISYGGQLVTIQSEDELSKYNCIAEILIIEWCRKILRTISVFEETAVALLNSDLTVHVQSLKTRAQSQLAGT